MASRIVVNTYSLDQYTTRIRNLLQRIDRLYPRVQRLYWTGEVKGLWNLYYRNKFYGGRQTVANCRTYINQTIAELNRVEAYLAQVDPLAFQEPTGLLIETINAADRSKHGLYISAQRIPAVGNDWIKKLISGESAITAIAGLLGYGWQNLDSEKKKLLIQAIRQIGSAVSSVDELKKQLLAATGARKIGKSASDKIDINKMVKDLLSDAASALKVGGKIKDNDDASMFSSVFNFASKVYGYITKTGATTIDNYTDSVSLVSSAASTFSAIAKYIDKATGKELFKYLPGLQAIGMFASGTGFSTNVVDIVKIFREYQAGDISGAEFGAKAVDTLSSGVSFGGNIVMFWNAWTPGQVEILTNGTITNGLVANTKYLAQGGTYLNIATSYLKGISIGIDRYGEYSADGDVDVDDWTAIVAEGGMQALNKLLCLGIIPEDTVRSASDKALGFVDNWGHAAADYIDSHPEWAYWRDKNKVTNILTRVAGCGKVANDAITNKLPKWGNGISTFARETGDAIADKVDSWAPDKFFSFITN